MTKKDPAGMIIALDFLKPNFFGIVNLPRSSISTKRSRKMASPNKEHRELKNLAEESATEDAVNRAKRRQQL